MLIRTPTDLGAVIRERRRALKLDQAQVAARIGTSRQWVISIEQGHPRANLGLVLRALDALGIRLDSGLTTGLHRPKDAPNLDLDAIVAAARKGRK